MQGHFAATAKLADFFPMQLCVIAFQYLCRRQRSQGLPSCKAGNWGRRAYNRAKSSLPEFCGAGGRRGLTVKFDGKYYEDGRYPPLVAD